MVYPSGLNLKLRGMQLFSVQRRIKARFWMIFVSGMNISILKANKLLYPIAWGVAFKKYTKSHNYRVI